MIPFDVMTSDFDVVSNSRSIFISSEGIKMFRYPVVESTLSFPYVNAFGKFKFPPNLITISVIFIYHF